MKVQKRVILTLRRSGSNTLVVYLHQLPHVVNYRDLSGDYTLLSRLQRLLQPKTSTSEYLDGHLSSKSAFWGGQIYSAFRHTARRQRSELQKPGTVEQPGVECFSPNFSRRHLDNYLAERPVIKVIDLVRDNLQGRWVSFQRLKSYGTVSSIAARVHHRRNLFFICQNWLKI